MKHWCVWVWFTAGLFMACSSENQWLDTALNLAGDNRAELQKVLDRKYSINSLVVCSINNVVYSFLSFYDLLLHQFNPKMCGFYSN